MARTPTPHVEPLYGAGGRWALLLVQQDQLLLGTHGCALQHLLQLGEEWGLVSLSTEHSTEPRTFTELSPRSTLDTSLMAGSRPREGSVEWALGLLIP